MRSAAAGEVDAVGLDGVIDEIKERICRDSKELQILPITGTGGIGKTTLARKLYHDSLLVHRFHIRAWVTVSQDYSFGNIFSSLLLSIKRFLNEEEEITDLTNKHEIAENVRKTLYGRKYLIVIDDMWSTKTWDEIKFYFPDNSNGSRIILTTRLEDVAAHAHSSKYFHRMKFMEVDQSLCLLQKEVCKGHCRLPMSETMQDIAGRIAKSCGGLPLAIVVIAGLLSEVSETEAAWDQIANSINALAITADEANYAEILSLSYTHLPERLRNCFLYMGAFPDDYDIRVSKLIKLWIAEGFVELDAAKTLEGLAEECLEDLVKRNLVLVRKRKSNGRIKSCGLHGLLRDLCLMKGLEENFLLYFMGKFVLPEIFEDQLRVSVSYSDSLLEIEGSTIRTIICYQPGKIDSLKKFGLLRILDMVKADLPSHVFEFLDLKLLALSSPTVIPASISNIQELQTLIVGSAKPSVVALPVEIWKMSCLRHLISSSFHPLPHPDGTALPLENLLTLSLVKNFVCSERMVELIPNVKKLGICYTGEKLDEEYHLENLARLEQLEKLKMEIRSDFPAKQCLNPVFPKLLKKLTLSGWRLPWEKLSIVGSLPNLQVLKLRNYACEGNLWETNDEEFKELKFLLIDKSDLETWSIESTHFPKLKTLVLQRCPSLVEIPGDIGDIPALELIEVDSRNQSLVESAKSIQQEQIMEYGNNIHVRY